MKILFLYPKQRAWAEGVEGILGPGSCQKKLTHFRILTSVPGIGYLAAVTLLAEIGDFTDISSGAQTRQLGGTRPDREPVNRPYSDGIDHQVGSPNASVDLSRDCSLGQFELDRHGLRAFYPEGWSDWVRQGDRRRGTQVPHDPLAPDDERREVRRARGEPETGGPDPESKRTQVPDVERGAQGTLPR